MKRKLVLMLVASLCAASLMTGCGKDEVPAEEAQVVQEVVDENGNVVNDMQSAAPELSAEELAAMQAEADAAKTEQEEVADAETIKDDIPLDENGMPIINSNTVETKDSAEANVKTETPEIVTETEEDKTAEEQLATDADLAQDTSGLSDYEQPGAADKKLKYTVDQTSKLIHKPDCPSIDGTHNLKTGGTILSTFLNEHQTYHKCSVCFADGYVFGRDNAAAASNQTSNNSNNGSDTKKNNTDSSKNESANNNSNNTSSNTDPAYRYAGWEDKTLTYICDMTDGIIHKVDCLSVSSATENYTVQSTLTGLVTLNPLARCKDCLEEGTTYDGRNHLDPVYTDTKAWVCDMTAGIIHSPGCSDIKFKNENYNVRSQLYVLIQRNELKPCGTCCKELPTYKEMQEKALNEGASNIKNDGSNNNNNNNSNETASNDNGSNNNNNNNNTPAPNVKKVWIASSGDGRLYHVDANCSSIDSATIAQLPTEDAIEAGYQPCPNCSH